MRKTVIGLTLSALLLALSIPASAQQPKKIPRIGFLSGGSSGRSANIEAFRQGLRDLGYIEGKNIIIEYRFAEGQSDARYPALLSDLIGLKVELIVADGSGPSRAAKKATSTIPIVMTTSTDPVGQGLIASYARPGGNISGLTSTSEELGGKLLELTKEIVTRLTRVMVVAPAGAAGKFFLKETQAPARALGLQLIMMVVGGPEDYENIVEAAVKERAEALLSRLGPSPLLAEREKFMALAVKRRLPVVSQGTNDAEAGALLSYGRDQSAQYRRVSVFVDKILKGAKPAELPVEAPTKVELVINLKTAKQIGLTIPQSVLYRADRVIK
jgi:putative tryptophan/tyrosine transport system substrate-binding protein